jgi:hypothetical protein
MLTTKPNNKALNLTKQEDENIQTEHVQCELKFSQTRPCFDDPNSEKIASEVANLLFKFERMSQSII